MKDHIISLSVKMVTFGKLKRGSKLEHGTVSFMRLGAHPFNSHPLKPGEISGTLQSVYIDKEMKE